MENEKSGFLKNHIDMLTIVGVNIAIFAVLVTMFISNSNRIDAANARSDTLHVLCYDLLKEIKK